MCDHFIFTLVLRIINYDHITLVNSDKENSLKYIPQYSQFVLLAHLDRHKFDQTRVYLKDKLQFDGS